MPHRVIRLIGNRWRWPLAAAVVFAVALTIIYGSIWREGADRVIPTTELPPEISYLNAFGRADSTYCAWLVGRNAYTLVNHPMRLFDTEQCAPAKRAMVFCISLITM